ncbi:MAG: hypothetical protein GY738_00110 [Pseudoalteromonas sp.]|nr:hypothetical protein [Pseudoalteromonas sp.]
MDLSNCFASSSAVIELKNPETGEVIMDEGKGKKALPQSFTVMGTHTREYKKLAKMLIFEAAKQEKKRDLDKMSPSELIVVNQENEDKVLGLHVKAILGCNIFIHGKKLEGTVADYKALFSDERTAWIYDQFKVALEDNKLFFKG